MRKTERKRDRNGLMSLLLFGVFATSILGVVLSGARVYRQLVRRDEHAYEQRTAAQYVTMRLRQCAGRASVASFGDGEALELWEQIGGEDYVTRVYCSDGALRELFSRADVKAEPQDGQIVLAAKEMRFQMEEDLLTVWITNTDGEALELILALRGRGGVE